MTSSIPEGIVRTPEGFYVLKEDSHLSRWVENHKRLDVAEGQIEFYKKYIPVGGVVVDAGASLGDHTATYAKLVGPTGSVFAIEPHPTTFKALTLNFAAANNVTTINSGLSDRVGQARFIREVNIGASHISAMGDGDTVRVASLDHLFIGHHRLDFIHLDLEGYEFYALHGARRVIADFRPTIVLEINHECLARYSLIEKNVLNVLDWMGYNWQELEPHLNSTYPQRDILCLPR